MKTITPRPNPLSFFAMVLITGILAGIVLFLLSSCAQKKEPYIDPLIWNLLEQKPREKQTKEEPPKEEPDEQVR